MAGRTLNVETIVQLLPLISDFGRKIAVRLPKIFLGLTPQLIYVELRLGGRFRFVIRQMIGFLNKRIWKLSVIRSLLAPSCRSLLLRLPTLSAFQRVIVVVLDDLTFDFFEVGDRLDLRPFTL